MWKNACYSFLFRPQFGLYGRQHTTGWLFRIGNFVLYDNLYMQW
jgi:hypothetical protein